MPSPYDLDLTAAQINTALNNAHDSFEPPESGSGKLVQSGTLHSYIGAQISAALSSAIPYMGVYVSTPAETTISTAGTFVKMAGSTAITNQSLDMDDGATVTHNRIRYTGTATKHFHVVAQTTMGLTSGTNQNVAIQVYHYDDSTATGTLMAHSEARATISGTQEFQITTHADLMMDTNDYLEIHVTNNTNTNNVEAKEAYLFAMGMPRNM